MQLIDRLEYYRIIAAKFRQQSYQLHSLRPTELTVGHKQVMANNIRGAIQDPNALSGFERLYQKLTGYPSFTVAGLCTC